MPGDLNTIREKSNGRNDINNYHGIKTGRCAKTSDRKVYTAINPINE